MIYPARLYGAVYFALLFVFGTFYANIRLIDRFSQWEEHSNTKYNKANDAYTKLNDVYTTLKDLDSRLDNITDSDFLVLKDSANLHKTIAGIAEAFVFGWYFAIVIGLIWGIYSSLIIFASWKKKIIFLRLGVPTYRFNNFQSEFPVWASASFMGVIGAFIATGTLLVSWIFGICITILAWPPFWDDFVCGYWKWIVGYCLYFLIDYVFIRSILFSCILSDKRKNYQMKKKYKDLFNVVLILYDFLYMPLALSGGFFKFVWLICIALLSFLRPDINVFPRNWETWDYGYFTFIASVRLNIEREIEFAAFGSNSQLAKNMDLDSNGIEILDLGKSGHDDKKEYLLQENDKQRFSVGSASASLSDT